MAGPKKPSRKKDTTSPNVVLVVFLIIFVLTSIVLGVWVYFNYGEMDRLEGLAKNAKKEAAAAQTAMTMQRTMADTGRMAVFGGQRLDPDRKTEVKLNWEVLTNDTGAFKDEKDRAEYAAALDDMKKDLGVNEAAGEFTSSYRDKLKDLAAQLRKAQSLYENSQKELTAAREEFKTLQEKQEAYWASALAKIQKGNDSSLKESRTQSEQMVAALDKNRELNQQFVDLQQEGEKVKRGLERQIRELQLQLAEKGQQRGEAVSLTRSNEPHALLLDVSTGKPLWDQPVGEITGVNMGDREVTINVGSRRGLKPDLTFTVFATEGQNKRPFGKVRANLEVTRLLNGNSAVARITALYDSDGLEIPLDGNLRGRAKSEAENAIREGFPIFNMFWGNRVAIAGYSRLSGAASTNPAEQMRQLNEFIYLLERQGMTVDAYLDLTDGEMKGSITPETRYLIKGDDLHISAQALENADPQAERAKAINDAAEMMRKQAIENGMFVISVPNFAAVIGYRPPLGSGANSRTEFRPMLPSAGSVYSGINRQSRPAENRPADDLDN